MIFAPQVGDCDGAPGVPAAPRSDGDPAPPAVLAVHPSVTFNAAIDGVVSGKVIQSSRGRASVLPPIWLITALALQLKTQFQMFRKLNSGCLR